MRVKRRRREAATLEVTAFINLVVVLVPFLLSTAVFTRLAVIDLTLPAQSSGVEQLKVDDLKLEVTIRPGAIEVSDRIGGLIERVPHGAAGADLPRLQQVLAELKQRFPGSKAVTVLAQPDTPYDLLVHVMDSVREAQLFEGREIVRNELFPEISIGDAPVAGALVAQR